SFDVKVLACKWSWSSIWFRALESGRGSCASPHQPEVGDLRCIGMPVCTPIFPEFQERCLLNILHALAQYSRVTSGCFSEKSERRTRPASDWGLRSEAA